MIRRAWSRMRRFARFVALSFGAGLRIVIELANWLVFLVGGSVIAGVVLLLKADSLVIVIVLSWLLLLWFLLGAFRIWDRADTREPEEAAPAGTLEMPPELRLRALAKNGRKLKSQLVGDFMMDRITANGVLPWVQSVEGLLIALGPEYVQRFQDADDGVPTWSAVMQPGAYKDVMEKRLAVLEQILSERDVGL